MQKLPGFIGLIGICILLYGCPFESSYPIDHSQAYYIDNNLLGSWKNRSDNKIYTLSKYNEYTYQLGFTDSGGEWVYYYPFMSFVNSQSFLCVPHKDEYEDYYYYLYQINTSNNANTLNVRGLKQPVDFYPASSAQLRTWIVNNMNNSSFYSSNPEDSYTLDRY
jgi:hypothetical protein